MHSIKSRVKILYNIISAASVFSGNTQIEQQGHCVHSWNLKGMKTDFEASYTPTLLRCTREGGRIPPPS